MSPYLIVFSILFFTFLPVILNNQRIFITFSNIKHLDVDNVSFFIVFMLTTLMLMFRYGQGTDYFTYNYIYNWLTIEGVLNPAYGTEFGWKVINYLIKSMGLPFEGFIVILSMFEMLCLRNFIKVYCGHYKVFAFLILYPTFIFIYMYSALRQGLSMCVFLGFMLPLLERQKYKNYIIISLLLGSIHTVSFIYVLLVPISKLERKINVQKLDSVKFFCAILSLSFGLLNIGSILKSFVPTYALAHSEVAFSYPPVIENIVLMSLTTWLYYYATNKHELRKYYIMFSFGLIFFFLSSWITMLANRTFSCWKYVYLVFFIKYARYNRGLRKQIVLAFCFLSSSYMMVRNIDAIRTQGGGYIDSVNAFNYPYISIFDKSRVYLRSSSGAYISRLQD